MPSTAPTRPTVAIILAMAIVGFLLSASCPSAAQSANGLVAAYSFNEGTGTVVTDLSGSNITGAIVGATWTTGGRYGNALSFNGTSSYVDLGNPAALQLTSSMTLEAWVKAAANPANDGQIIAKSKSNGIGWQLKTSPDTGSQTFGIAIARTSSAETQRYSTTVRSLNTWYHVAGVYNASAKTLQIYVNGVLDNGQLKGTISTTQVNAGVNVNIGRRTGGYYFNGIIDEVRIYNRALSQAEIQSDMNTPLGGTPPPPDTTPPTDPSNLGATAVSSSQINLSWTGSTDNVAVAGYQVERCQGAGCTNFAQIAAPTGTTFSDTALAASTTYGYRVRAADGAGNVSGYSNITSATTSAPPPPDTTPPTDPSNLGATAVSSSQINLSWTASTDNFGVAGYQVERCQSAGCANFAQIATPIGTTFSNTGLAASTSYSYRVRALDGAGNLSGYSNVASATTASTQISAPTFVQQSYAAPQTTSTASVVVTYGAAQTAGNLNVVVAGWNNTTSAVTSVSDTAGNLYAPAVGPTAGSGLSQSIYYAKNIVAAGAGVNKVTVVFSPAAAYPDIRILEYSGIDPVNAVDTTAAAVGSSATSNSGAATTSNANNLLFGANMVATGTTGPGTGFTSRVITSPDGDIAEDQLVATTGSYSATAPLSTGAWVMQLVAFRAAGSPPPGPDTTPPIVSITSPGQGATVSGLVAITANASDNRGVAGVQFKADGVNIGTEVTSDPYTTTWDVTALTTSSHTLTAVARDTSGNLATSSPVTVTVQSAATVGQWTGPYDWPMVSVHTILMRTGKLLLMDGQSLGSFAQVWDPATASFTAKTAPDNLFCSGHITLSNGKVLVVGGHSSAHTGLNTSDLFDPQTQTWTHGPNMQFARWYPTATALPDGRIITISGETNCDGCYEPKHEIYNPTSNSWSVLTGADFSFAYYPHPFILPDGRLLVSSTAEAPIISRVLNFRTLTWTAIGTTALDGGSAIMYQPGKILKLGTSVNPDAAVRQSFPTAYVLDMNQPTPAWRQVASMAFPRTYMTTVMLPDGNVLVAGGGRTTDAVLASGAVLQAEIWSPTTETFTTVAPMTKPRLYHSTAVLMPDGRVVVSGGGRFNGPSEPTDQPNAEYYLPPYFFKGARPTITSAPATIQYGQNFSVQTPDAAQITSVVLMRLGSVTHAFNMGQNYVPVTFQAVSGALTVQAPANGNLAVPGDYMLFILNGNGVPSVAAMVNLPPSTPSSQPPSAPTNLVGTGGLGSASLSWTASTGPNGVSGYYVYRATAPGVVPSAANRVGQPTGTSFVDTSMPSSGTYYYVVTAHDSAGTESLPSNEAVASVTADTAPPTDPTSLAATTISNSQINLSWTGSTDNVGVAQYRVERCQSVGCANFAQIATPTGTTFNDTGLAASTSYSYRVRAADGAGNVSNYSNVASATTQAASQPPATPTFVQQNYAVPQSASVATVSVTYTAAQTAGNLNVVVVGWNNTTAVVTSVTDTSGSVYTRVVGPTVGTGLAQSIYYAKNIAAAAAGVNKVTVAFSPAAAYPDIRILEYSGIDPINPVDTTAAAVGSTATSSSGAVTTTNANDLLFGANTVATLTTAAGAGFTSRVLTNPNGDIAEDELVAATGSYSATAPVSPSGAWVMQLVAFRAAGSPAPLALPLESGGPVQ